MKRGEASMGNVEGGESSSGTLVEQLRRDFDQAFSRPAQVREGETVHFVVVRAGAQELAVRVDELAGIEPVPPIVELPGNVPYRLGLSAMGGQLVPIFDLAQLLECKTSEAPRVVLLHGNKQRVGLACQALVEQLRVPASRVRSVELDSREGAVTDAIVQASARELPVLRMPRVVERIVPKAVRTGER